VLFSVVDDEGMKMVIELCVSGKLFFAEILHTNISKITSRIYLLLKFNHQLLRRWCNLNRIQI